MKTTLFFLSLLALAPLAQAQDQDHEQCSALLYYPDGNWQLAHVECDSPYAGKCLNDTTLADGTHDWVEVNCEVAGKKEPAGK